MIDCDIPGCTCTKFEPADPKIEQTQGGDAHDHALDLPGQQRGSGAAGADVTGPAGATETPPAGGPDHWKQSEAELPPTTPAGPPDLAQAIHAATVALRNHHPAIGLSDPWAQPARIAVEAAAPVLLHVTRDRHAALEVHVAELRGALEQIRQLYLDLTAKGQLNFYVTKSYDVAMAALQTDGPARGHAILHEVQRLRTFKGDIRAALRPGRWRGFDGPDGVSKDEVIADVVGALTALDQAAQREVDR